MGTPPIQMANLGMADTLIIMVIALVVFGPRRLPQIGRQIGKLMYEFRKASNDFKFQMEEELRNSEETDRRKKEEERLRALALAAPAPESPASETQPPEPGAAPEATPEAAPAASPYPWESVYPPIPTPAVETQPEPSGTQTELTLQPPSTGETVAAAPPKRTRRKKATPPPAATDAAAPAKSETTHVLEAENMPPLHQAPASIQEEAPVTEQVPNG